MNIAEQFCGQTQPHAAHWWQTPQVYGTTTLVSHYQCAGLAHTGCVLADRIRAILDGPARDGASSEADA